MLGESRQSFKQEQCFLVNYNAGELNDEHAELISLLWYIGDGLHFFICSGMVFKIVGKYMEEPYEICGTQLSALEV